MEESMSESEAQKPFQSPPRRRRSTFFERRESFAAQVITENNDPNVGTSSTESDVKNKQDLERYYGQLLLEKEQWKKEVNHRRHKYRDLRQQYLLASKAPSRSWISYSALTNEDIEFVKGKTNVSKIVESQLKLHKSVKETRALYRRVNDLDDVLLSHCEAQVNKITKYILDNSTIEPME